MARVEEQVSYSGYIEDPQYWQEYARQIGGIEVCDDETGEPMFIIK